MGVTATGRRWIELGVGFLAGMTLTPILASFLTGLFVPLDQNTNQVVALATARELSYALDEYRADHYRLPSAGTSLEVLVPEYIDRAPLDPWGHPFVYSPGSDGLWADVLSYGADGTSGGTGVDTDVSSRFGILTPSIPWTVTVLLEAAFFVVPLVGLFGAYRWAWAAGVLAGSGLLCGVVLLAMIDFHSQLMAAGPLFVAMACFVGCVAVLRRLPGAPVLTFIAVVVAYLVLGQLVSA